MIPRSILLTLICLVCLYSCDRKETEFQKLTNKLTGGSIYFQGFDNPKKLIPVDINQLLLHYQEINVTKYKAVGFLIFKDKTGFIICKIRTNGKVFGPIGNEYYKAKKYFILDNPSSCANPYECKIKS